MADRTPEKLWKSLRDGWKPAANGFNMHAHRFELARKHSSADLVEVSGRARAFITQTTLPETPPDAEAAAYLLAIYFMHPGATAVFHAIASYGVELALEAVIGAHGLKMVNQAGNYGVQVLVREPRDGTAYANELRDVVRPADAREKCEARAAAVFPSASFWLKLTLSITHPTRPEWAAEIGRAILADKTMRYPPIQAVFGSLRDRELVEPLLERRSSFNSFDDLVRTFQGDVLQPLLGILEKPKDRGELKAVARALCAYESEEVARAFSKLLVKKEVREPAIAWFLRFPALARAALDEVAKGKNKNAKYAQAILEQVGRTTSAEDASVDELPWILVHPPWIEKKRKKKTGSKRIELELLPRKETVEIPHEDLLRILQFAQNQPHANAPPMSEEEALAWQTSLERGTNMPMWAHEGKVVPEDKVIAAFNEGRPNLVTNKDLDPWIAIARFGVAALPGFIRYVTDRFGRSYWGSAIHGKSSPYTGIAADVEFQFERIAQKRGVSVDELEDRITPTEDLDADGGTTLDYGSRTLRVGFDTTLAPFVLSESGERVRQLPPKRKADDKKLVAAAQARWHDLKEDVATIAERRVRALERAMSSGRSWTKEQFLDVWVRHPLLFHMAQGLVWASGDVRFRVAEDRSFAGGVPSWTNSPSSSDRPCSFRTGSISARKPNAGTKCFSITRSSRRSIS